MRERIDWPSIKTVLDLGGRPEFWRNAGLDQTLDVTCLNVVGPESEERAGETTVRLLVADATRPPVDPTGFDLVFSNSVIEHVGGPEDIARLAQVLRSGRRYFMQTPNRYFLIEPHFILPLHFVMPRGLKVMIVRFWDRGPRRRTKAEAERRVDGVRLLRRRDVEQLFPDGELVVERRWLQDKSFMVFGNSDRDR